MLNLSKSIFLFYLLGILGCGSENRQVIPQISSAEIQKYSDEASAFSELHNDKKLSKKIMTSLKKSLDQQAEKEDFSWCGCQRISTKSRILMATRIIAKTSHMARSKLPLVLTSLGSGNLLGEYLITKGLLDLGIKNIEIVLIDPGYKVDTEAYRAALNFRKKITEPGLTVHIFQSFDEYRAAMRTNPRLASDIFFAIDVPDVPEEQFRTMAQEALNPENSQAQSYYL